MEHPELLREPIQKRAIWGCYIAMAITRAIRLCACRNQAGSKKYELKKSGLKIWTLF